MRTIILNEDGYNMVANEIINESYGDKVELVKKYLDNNFMKATYTKDGNSVGIFVKMNNHVPTDKSYWKQDVLDKLEKEFNNIISDKKERGGFLNQIIDDWYNNKISKYGNLSTYNFFN